MFSVFMDEKYVELMAANSTYMSYKGDLKWNNIYWK